MSEDTPTVDTKKVSRMQRAIDFLNQVVFDLDLADEKDEEI